MTLTEIKERLAAIAARKAEIANEVREDEESETEEEGEEATEPAETTEEQQQTLEEMDALLNELEALLDEEKQLVEEEAAAEAEAEEEARSAEAKRREIRARVAAGAGSIKQKSEEKIMTNNEIRNSAAYINAYAEYIKTGDDRECRSLLTENVSGAVPVPSLVDDTVRTAWENDAILSKVKKTYFRGNLRVPYEISADGAIEHTEGTNNSENEEELVLGIVEMIPKNIKKWITVSDEVVAMGGEAFLNYIYNEITYQITKKLAELIVADIAALPQSGNTAPNAAAVTGAPSLTIIPEAYAALCDQAANPVVIMNRATYADFMAAYAAGSFAVDPFMGLTPVFTSALPSYTDASATDVYAIVGDLNGAQINFPEGEGLVLKYDDLSLAEHDMVKIVGREYAAHAVTAPFWFTLILKDGSVGAG